MHSVQGNRIVMLNIDTNGNVDERIPGVGQESWLDRTLLGAMYPDIHVALVSVPTEALNDIEENDVANSMIGICITALSTRWSAPQVRPRMANITTAMPHTNH